MKIIRWLLSHTFLILLIVVVIYGYMFWGNLAGENTPAGKALAYLSNEFVEVEEFIAAVKAKQVKLSEEKQSVSVARSERVTEQAVPVTKSEQMAAPGNNNIAHLPVNPQHDYQPPVVTENTEASPRTEAEIAKNNIPVAAIAQVQQREPEVLTAARNETVINNAPAISAKTEPAEKFISAETEKQLDNVDERGQAISATQQYEAVRSLWITARKSFYQRNYKLSEQSYKQVIDKTKDNVDAYGELGNVYFNQGKNKEAASAYFEAAAILVRNGQTSRARSLMGVLRHLDESKADELKQLIDSMLS